MFTFHYCFIEILSPFNFSKNHNFDGLKLRQIQKCMFNISLCIYTCIKMIIVYIAIYSFVEWQAIRTKRSWNRKVLLKKKNNKKKIPVRVFDFWFEIIPRMYTAKVTFQLTGEILLGAYVLSFCSIPKYSESVHRMSYIISVEQPQKKVRRSILERKKSIYIKNRKNKATAMISFTVNCVYKSGTGT